MKKRLFLLLLTVCLIVTAVPFASAAEAPGSFEAYMIMSKLRAEYPEGMPWNNDNVYKWNGGIFTHGAGCAGFAFLLSDAVFGNLPARKLTGVPADALRPGDILRVNGDTHSVIVLQNTQYGIVVAEGNYNASIHWDRVLSRADAENADYVLTRYPENWVDTAPAQPILETAQIMSQLNWLEKSFPQGMHWGYNYSYNWQGGILNGSAGSYAFAMMLSDTVFSNLPACTKQGMTLSDLRVGDIVVDKNGGAGIVLEKVGDHVRLAEGQDGGIVNWQKTMNESELSQAIMTITRYPDAQTSDGAEKTLEQKAQEAMNGLRDQYPEGKKWGSRDSYTWNGRPNETGTGCAAFAYILSDGAFGAMPAREVTDYEFDDVRAGDILKIDGYTVIVLETYKDAVMVAEGEYNGGIHWGRYLSRDEVEGAECMLTRYPMDYMDPEATVQVYQPSGNVIGEGSCGFKGSPVYWKVTDEGTLVIYGPGVTDNYNYNYNYNLPPWYDYRNSITRVVVQEGTWKLGTQTLANLPNLTEVILPSTLEEIDADCFTGCTALESVRLPEGLREIGNRAFQRCYSLKNINFPASLTRIGISSFEQTALTMVELKNGLTSLGADAFKNCQSLNVMALPGSLGRNLESVITWCNNLKTLTLGEGIRELGRSFAEGCENLRVVYFPSTLTRIYDSAFRGTGIVEVTLPSSLEYLGNRAFASCQSLVSVTVNHTVAEFGTDVFSNCNALRTLNIADGVTDLGKATFAGCDSLEYVSLPGSLGRVEVNMFADTWNCGPVVAVLEEGITSVGKMAFMQCTRLKEVHLPASLKIIEENAFATNADFWEMTFYYYGTPEQWTQVEIQYGNHSFQNATFIFADSLVCNHTLYETIPAVNPTCQQTGLSSGQRCKVCDEILTPQAVLPTVEHSYDQGACIWCREPDSRPSDTVIDSGSCGANVNWKLQLDGTLIIFGRGKMNDYPAEGNHPGNGYEDKITKVIIEAGVTSIGNCAFWCCEEIESVTIGPDVQTIGNSAFTNCLKLKEIVIPENVQKLGHSAFNNCNGLHKVEIKNGDIYLDSRVFAYLESLTTVIIPQGNIQMSVHNPFSGTPYLKEAMDASGFAILGEYLLYYGALIPSP